MSPSKFLHAGGWICLATIVMPQSVLAFDCVRDGELPRFVITLDPSAMPKPPSDESRTKWVLYRDDLEIFRLNKIEEYNRSLMAYGENLTAIDSNYRAAVRDNICSEKQYQAVREKIAGELKKISDYKRPYDRSINVYKIRIHRCLVEINRLRLAAHRFIEPRREIR